ncbi:MAG: hypothetical protein KJP02_02680 [Octadecabacter sp.]|nr:hypothetical protein [Octadecabacter sp.]
MPKGLSTPLRGIVSPFGLSNLGNPGALFAGGRTGIYAEGTDHDPQPVWLFDGSRSGIYAEGTEHTPDFTWLFDGSRSGILARGTDHDPNEAP